MKKSNAINLCSFFLLAVLTSSMGQSNVIISSDGHHGAIDCAAPSIPMQVDNPNPNYDYHWHYVLFDSSFGGCSFDNWTNLIGYGTSINVPTNMGNFFAIVCYADSGGLLWDDSHWFKVRKPALNAPVCINPVAGPCGERYVSISPQVFYLDSNYTYINLQWLKNGVPVSLSGSFPPFEVSLNTSGYYCLRAQVGNCGYAYSDSIHVIVNKPAPVITASGPTTFCSGGNVLLQVNTGPGTTYQWKKNGTNIAGATSSSYSAFVSGNYKVVKTNAQGCSGTSSATPLTVYSNPTATVTAMGPTTFCVGDSVKLKTQAYANYSYQWKKNNVNIIGATSNKIQAKTAGNYKVKVTNGHGCTAISSPVTVTTPCRNELHPIEKAAPDIIVYPNPSTGEFTLMMPSCRVVPEQISVVGLTGRKIEFNYREKQDGSLVINGLSNGIYFLQVSCNNRIITEKIIVAE